MTDTIFKNVLKKNDEIYRCDGNIRCYKIDDVKTIEFSLCK